MSPVTPAFSTDEAATLAMVLRRVLANVARPLGYSHEEATRETLTVVLAKIESAEKLAEQEG